MISFLQNEIEIRKKVLPLPFPRTCTHKHAYLFPLRCVQFHSRAAHYGLREVPLKGRKQIFIFFLQQFFFKKKTFSKRISWINQNPANKPSYAALHIVSLHHIDFFHDAWITATSIDYVEILIAYKFAHFSEKGNLTISSVRMEGKLARVRNRKRILSVDFIRSHSKLKYTPWNATVCLSAK